MKIELTGGSVRGRDHLISGKNNQDSYVVRQGNGIYVAIVTDGCGSMSGSEIGARLIAQWTADYLFTYLTEEKEYGFMLPVKDVLDTILVDTKSFVIAAIDSACGYFPEKTFEYVTENFLCTIVGMFVYCGEVCFFSIGDGIIIINGEVIEIGPFPNNAPPYIAYNLLPSSIDPALLDFAVHRIIPLEELDNFLIGCDGVGDLIKVAGEPIPNKSDQVVKPISDFWNDDKYFKNNFAVNRTLTLISGGIPKMYVIEDENDPRGFKLSKQIVMGSGLLPDDTTLVVGRKVNE
jgi:hypothetical protein